MMGIPLTMLTFAGKLYADTLEGNLYIKAKEAFLQALDPVGRIMETLEGEKTEDGVRFILDGTIPTVQFLLKVHRI